MPLPGLEHSDERPPDARFPTLPDAHGRLAHLRAHAPRLNERREQSQQHHRVTVWCGQPGHRREFAPAVSASISVYGMMLPRPSDRSSHLREVGASNIQTVKFCRAGIVTEAVRTSTIASGARIHLYGSGIDRSAAESRLCRISGYTKLAFSTRTAVDLVRNSRTRPPQTDEKRARTKETSASASRVTGFFRPLTPGRRFFIWIGRASASLPRR